MADRIENEKFSRKVIYLLAQMENMSVEVLSDFYLRAGFTPNIKSWISFVSKFVLSLGLVFIVSGVIFFFAYNWRELHKFVKLSIVGSLILISATFALISDMKKFYAKLSMLAIALFTGCLLAVFDQIYQTGANAYDLFLNWAILITGIVFISNFKLLWFLWLVLINTSIVLFAGQILRNWINPYAFMLIYAIDAIALFTYEYFNIRNNPWFESRWLPRILGIAVVCSITVAGITGIFTDFENPGHIVCLVLALISYAWVIFLYSQKLYDLTSIVASCLCIIAMIFTVILKTCNFSSAATFLNGGLTIIGLTIASTVLLIKIDNNWKLKNEKIEIN